MILKSRTGPLYIIKGNGLRNSEFKEDMHDSHHRHATKPLSEQKSIFFFLKINSFQFSSKINCGITFRYLHTYVTQIDNQSQNLTNLGRVSNPPKTGFNCAPA